MKTIKVKVYQYGELSNEAKDKARQWLFENGDLYQFENDSLLQDAKEIGLHIMALDSDRLEKDGEFQTTADDCANKIIRYHGQNCMTYKTAKEYLFASTRMAEPIDEDTKAYDDYMAYKAECEGEFLGSLLEDYLIMQKKQFEYIQGEQAVFEMMEANGYTFTKDGKRFG